MRSNNKKALFQEEKWDRWSIAGPPQFELMNVPTTPPLCAIEVEMEVPSLDMYSANKLVSALQNRIWDVKGEGSLREGGIELVSRKPLPVDDAVQSMALLYPLFSRVRPTFRAAVHVHVNIQNLTRRQFMKALLLYYVREQQFYKDVGNGRDESVFCVPWSKANGTIRELVQAYATCDGALWADAILESPKYAGLNVRAASVFGSLEFRHCPTPARIEPTESLVRISNYIHSCTDIIEDAVHADALSVEEFINRQVDSMYPSREFQAHVASVYSVMTPLFGGDPMDGVPSIHTLKKTIPLGAIEQHDTDGWGRFEADPSVVFVGLEQFINSDRPFEWPSEEDLEEPVEVIR